MINKGIRADLCCIYLSTKATKATKATKGSFINKGFGVLATKIPYFLRFP